MKFGVQIPQEGVPFTAVLEHARAAERLGYETIFIPDHLNVVAVAPGSPAYEGWTTLIGALLGTERVRGGLLVACEAFRNPAWYANACATLDQMTGGRVIVGIGAGWYENEFRSYGYPWASGSVRVERLANALELMLAMWRGEGFDGPYYSAAGTADCPKPAQDPHPPIWIGGIGPKMLDVIARYADVWNAPILSAPEVAERADKLRARCAELGRPMVEVTWEGPVWIDEDGDKIAARIERNRASDNPTARRYAEVVVGGTPEQVTSRIKEFANAGVTQFVCHFGKTTDLRGTELFARAVMPAFG
jgi:alkanesulfonate monooxygenase SsuD/methylene tetrahydromethanopterin reductase-like flavin-dependent oxidoreductase (luciferase family)